MGVTLQWLNNEQKLGLTLNRERVLNLEVLIKLRGPCSTSTVSHSLITFALQIQLLWTLIDA